MKEELEKHFRSIGGSVIGAKAILKKHMVVCVI